MKTSESERLKRRLCAASVKRQSEEISLSTILRKKHNAEISSTTTANCISNICATNPEEG